MNTSDNHKHSYGFPPQLITLLIILVIISISCKLPQTIYDRVIYLIDPDSYSEPTPYADIRDYSFDQLWEEELNRLKENNLHCNSVIEDEYKPCLLEVMQGGETAEEALQFCSSIIEGLQKFDGEIQIRDSRYYYRDNDNDFVLNYPLTDRKVNGYIQIEFIDTSLNSECKVNIDFDFFGIYNKDTCTYSGFGNYSSTFEGHYCLGYSAEKTTPFWSATVMDGEIVGSIDDTSLSFAYPVR